MLQYGMYKETAQRLQPFVDSGYGNINPAQTFYQGTEKALTDQWGNAQAAIPQNVSNETIQNMPGYQFNLQSGLAAVQNAAAAKGLGVSGQALKQAANFATGLSNNYYQNYFQNAQQQFADQAQQYQNALAGKQLVFNQLYQPVSVGENAAAQVGNAGVQTAQAAGQAIQAAGQAQAAGIGASAGAINQGLTGAANNYLLYSMLGKMNSAPANPTPFGDQPFDTPT